MPEPVAPARLSPSEIQDRLGYRFSEPTLLDVAVTHGSARQAGAQTANERLAFLGDAVLGLVAAEKLYTESEGNPGVLTKARQDIVKNETLSTLAGKHGLQKGLVLGKGEERDGREKPSIRASLVEAILGAVFLDGGYAKVRDVVRRLQSQDA